MVTSTPDKIVDLNETGSNRAQQIFDAGKGYLDSAVSAAQEHPWKAAAIGAGVVATVAATAYGATKLAQRSNGASEDDSVIDPDVPPESASS